MNMFESFFNKPEKTEETTPEKTRVERKAEIMRRLKNESRDRLIELKFMNADGSFVNPEAEKQMMAQWNRKAEAELQEQLTPEDTPEVEVGPEEVLQEYVGETIARTRREAPKGNEAWEI